MADPLRDMLEGGMRVGEWSAWRCRWDTNPAEIDLLLVRPTFGWALFVSFLHAAWFRSRDATGTWCTCRASGPATEYGNTLERFYREAATTDPAADWPDGTSTAGQWAATAEADRLVLRHIADDMRVVVFKTRPLVTVSKKPVPGCDGPPPTPPSSPPRRRRRRADP